MKALQVMDVPLAIIAIHLEANEAGEFIHNDMLLSDHPAIYAKFRVSEKAVPPSGRTTRGLLE